MTNQPSIFPHSSKSTKNGNESLPKDLQSIIDKDGAAQIGCHRANRSEFFAPKPNKAMRRAAARRSSWRRTSKPPCSGSCPASAPTSRKQARSSPRAIRSSPTRPRRQQQPQASKPACGPRGAAVGHRREFRDFPRGIPCILLARQGSVRRRLDADVLARSHQGEGFSDVSRGLCPSSIRLPPLAHLPPPWLCRLASLRRKTKSTS